MPKFDLLLKTEFMLVDGTELISANCSGICFKSALFYSHTFRYLKVESVLLKLIVISVNCYFCHSQSQFVFYLYFYFAEITKTFCKKVKHCLSLLPGTFKFQLIFSHFIGQLKLLHKLLTSVHFGQI